MLGDDGDGANAEGEREPCNLDGPWAERNAKDRPEGLKFIRSFPGVCFLLLRLIMQPLRELIDKKLNASSMQHTLVRQAVACEEFLTSGLAWSVQDLQAVLGATCTHEETYFRKLDDLFLIPTRWRFMPIRGLTDEYRALGFRLLSKAGCTIAELVIRVHCTLPVVMFMALVSREFLLGLHAVPHCVLCTWARSLIAEFGDNPEDKYHAILLRVFLVLMHIGKVESRHSSIRRMLNTRSVLTHVVDFKEACALWFLQRFRLREQNAPVSVLCGKRKRTKDSNTI